MFTQHPLTTNAHDMHMTCVHCKSPLLIIFERLIVKMSASESVPVVFDHLDVAEGVAGTHSSASTGRP